jgi:hypothetical protein
MAAALVVAAAVLTAPGCGGDGDGPTQPVPPQLLGSWIVTSLVVQGQDLVAQGMSLSFHFSAEGEYSFLVHDDLLGLCDEGADCSDWGEFSASSSHITFDPGPGSETCTYSIAGNIMTLSGVLNGKTMNATLQRHGT